MMEALLDCDGSAEPACGDERMIDLLVTVIERSFSSDEDMNGIDAFYRSDLDELPNGLLYEYAHSIIADQAPNDNAW